MRCLPLTPLGLLVAAAAAQDAEERVVQVAVTSVSERSVFLDRGRDSGLKVGGLVLLFPPGTASVEVEIRSVSSTSARAEAPPGLPPIPVGTRGEARVVLARDPAPRPAAPPAAVPVHPPWTRREDARTADQPLLVPTYGQRPDQRPATLDGRLFASSQWNHDSGGDSSSDYLLSRLGVRADATNHLGHAERIRLAGEFADRRVHLQDAPDDADQDARIDLLSVAFGTEQWAATGLEAGRFLSAHLPEIGLVDGVEVVRRFQGGYRLGGGLGAYPLPFPSRESGDDLGAHVFLDYVADPSRSFAAAIGLQKTWHQGAPDRDLLLLRVEGRLWERVRLFGSAKVDFYSSSDTVKNKDVELTELLGTARWDGSTVGAGLTVSHFAWPDLKRAEYQDLPPELVRDGVVDRLSLNGSIRPAPGLRLQARADLWRDQDEDGTAFGLDGDLGGVIRQGSNLTASVFQTDGGYSSGPGARLLLRSPLGAGSWRLGYRWYRYDLDDLVTGVETYTRQSAELGLSLPISDSGDLDCSLERWFGDREDAWSLGLYLQWRF